MRKTKIQLKENSTYYNKWTDETFKVTLIYDRQVEGEAPGTIMKRIQFVTAAGVHRECDYAEIRKLVQKVIDDKIDYESTLGEVFNSKEFVDTVTLYKMAQNGEIRARIHPKDRDQLADEYQQMTEVEVDWDFVDECAHEATNSNWAISYSINFSKDEEMWFNPNLNVPEENGRVLIMNNEMIKLLFEMGFKLGKVHDIKRLAKCRPPLKCMKG